MRVAAKKEGGLTGYSEVVNFTVDIPSGVEDNYVDDKPIKTVEDGQVVIYRNGQRYSLLGNKAQ